MLQIALSQSLRCSLVRMSGAHVLLVVLAIGLGRGDPIASVAANCMHSSIDNCRVRNEQASCRRSRLLVH